MALIKISNANRISTILLNRPEKKNALSPQLISELTTAFADAEYNPDVKVIVLKAAGTVFCAGADIEYLQELRQNSYDDNLADSSKLQKLFATIYQSSKLIIAQVEGHAIAGGCGLLSACDIVFAVPEAKFGYSEVKIGFIPALVAPLLAERIGGARSREMLLTGELIPAITALQYGLVNFVEDKTNIEDCVNELASKLCESNSGQSVKATKELLRSMSGFSIRDSMVIAAKAQRPFTVYTRF